MKYCILSVLIFVASCSSAKQESEFNKSFEREEKNEPQVNVQAPDVLLEKFEIEKDEAKSAPEKVSEKEVSKKKVAIKKEAKKVTPKVETLVTKNKKLPDDYPELLKEINKKAEAVWKQYKPNHFINEKNYLDIHYLGMTVGKIMVMNQGKKMIHGKEVWHLHARFKSAPFYSSIYELDDTVDTYVTSDEFLSLRYSLIQRESKQDVDDLQLNDRDQMKTFWFYKQKKSDGKIRNKEKEAHIPYFSIDPFSVLFFYQGLPLKNGDVYEIPLINKSKILILKSVVEGRETIETEVHKKVRAIRVHATTKYTGETLKDGDLTFWFTDDAKRTLIKASAKIKLGSVTADIVEGK